MSTKRNMFGSFGFAFTGIKEAFKKEPNFRFHTLAAIISMLVALFLHVSILSWAILVTTITSVMILELINTIVERITDIISPEYSENAKFIKDVSAAAVLISALAAVVVGLLLFLPGILQLLSSLAH